MTDEKTDWPKDEKDRWPERQAEGKKGDLTKKNRPTGGMVGGGKRDR